MSSFFPKRFQQSILAEKPLNRLSVQTQVYTVFLLQTGYTKQSDLMLHGIMQVREQRDWVDVSCDHKSQKTIQRKRPVSKVCLQVITALWFYHCSWFLKKPIEQVVHDWKDMRKKIVAQTQSPNENSASSF